MPDETARLDWQQRVIDEKAELDAKIKKLSSFIHTGRAPSGSNDYDKLHAYDQQLLLDQRSHMQHYAVILGERIRRFDGV